MTQTIIHHQNGYEAVVTELRRIADALETIPAGFGPSYVGLSIHAGRSKQTASIAAVDAVATAVIGKVGTTQRMGNGTYHHDASSYSGPVDVGIFQQVPSPADSELERLRAKVAELEAANARVDETPAEVARPVDFVDGPCGDPGCPNASWPHLASNDLALPVTVHFSFGHGQTDPETGKSLRDHYVTIVGPSYEACRAAMFASRYGNRWSFDYVAGTPQADEWIPQWTEHERIILPADAPGEPECSPECDEQDGDLPHLADCPARPGSEA